MTKSDFEGSTIVLDLDGTLVDSAPDLMSALNHVLVREGLTEVDLETIKSLIGHGGKVMLAKGFAHQGEVLTEPRLSSLHEHLTLYYRAHIADLGRPFPGVAAALDALAERGARLAVCTNKRGCLARTLLRAFGLADRFAAIVGSDGAAAPKPDPRHLLAAIEAAGGRRDRAVMVGDSASDAQVARTAAIPLVLVDFGYSDVPASHLGPDALISHFADLPAACARLLTTSG